MPSPFPGMNPYIEGPDIWEDFHHNLASEIQYQLTPHLRPRYVATLIPRVDYDEVNIAAITPYWIKPDVSVVRVDDRLMGRAAVADAIAPAPLIAIEEDVAEYNVEIKEVKTGMLVTAIEILSPANKRPSHEAFDAYRRKRRDLHRAGVHLLEIDLLRAGVRAVGVDFETDTHYAISLRRSGAGGVEVWPVRLRDTIPVVPVPLFSPDPDVPLNLNRAIQNIYDGAAYDLRIDYTQPPPKPDLAPADAQWLDALLQTNRLHAAQTSV